VSPVYFPRSHSRPVYALQLVPVAPLLSQKPDAEFGKGGQQGQVSKPLYLYTCGGDGILNVFDISNPEQNPYPLNEILLKIDGDLEPYFSNGVLHIVRLLITFLKPEGSPKRPKYDFQAIWNSLQLVLRWARYLYSLRRRLNSLLLIMCIQN
jgi:hypothetical protein